MTAPKRPDDGELMLHADNELDERAARAVGDALADDPVLRDKLAALGQLGELVRGHLELSADEVPDARLGAMWREIEKQIELGGDTKAVASEANERDPAPAGAWRRVSSFFDRFRGHIITGVVSAGAVAALALVLRPTGDRATSAPERAPIEARPAALSIEALDTPGGSPNVFHLQDEDGAATVIWVTPADTVEGL